MVGDPISELPHCDWDRTGVSCEDLSCHCRDYWLCSDFMAHALKAQETKVAIVDAASGILSNPFALFNLPIWKNYTLVVALGATAWSVWMIDRLLPLI